MAKPKRVSPGKVRVKFHHTHPALPKPLSKILPQKMKQTPVSHPKEEKADKFSPDKPWGEPPPDKFMTPPEWAIYWALTQLIGDKQFVWRYPVAFARYTFGQYTPFLDFMIPGKNTVILLNYVSDQLGFGSFGLSHNNLLKVQIESEGLFCIFIDSDVAEEDPIYYTSEALNHRDHSRWFQGV